MNVNIVCRQPLNSGSVQIKELEWLVKNANKATLRRCAEKSADDCFKELLKESDGELTNLKNSKHQHHSISGRAIKTSLLDDQQGIYLRKKWLTPDFVQIRRRRPLDRLINSLSLATTEDDISK